MKSEEFTSKEYNEQMALIAWTIKKLPDPIGQSPMAFESFCEDVYRRHEQRKAINRAEEEAEDL